MRLSCEKLHQSELWISPAPSEVPLASWLLLWLILLPLLNKRYNVTLQNVQSLGCCNNQTVTHTISRTSSQVCFASSLILMMLFRTAVRTVLCFCFERLIGSHPYRLYISCLAVALDSRHFERAKVERKRLCQWEKRNEAWSYRSRPVREWTWSLEWK